MSNLDWTLWGAWAAAAVLMLVLSGIEARDE